MTWLQYPLLPALKLQSALDTIDVAQFILKNTFLRSFFMLALHKPFNLNKFLFFVVHIESAVRNLSSLNFCPLKSVFVIGNP